MINDYGSGSAIVGSGLIAASAFVDCTAASAFLIITDLRYATLTR